MILYLNLCGLKQTPSALETMLAQNMPQNTESLYTLEDLERRIRTGIYDICALVIELCRTSPVSGLLAFREELKDLYVILTLNDLSGDDQIAKLLKLYPRHINFDNNFHKVMAILQNRMHYIQENIKDTQTKNRN